MAQADHQCAGGFGPCRPFCAFLQLPAPCCALGLSPEVQTPHLSAASLSPLPFSPPHSHTTGQPHAKGLPSLSLQLISLASFVWWVYFAFAFSFLLFIGNKEGVTNPRADVRTGLTSLGEGVMPPAPTRSLEPGKTRGRRALLQGAGSAHPFLSPPGPAGRLLLCCTAPSSCSIPPLHPAAPSRSRCSIPPGPGVAPVTFAVAGDRSR